MEKLTLNEIGILREALEAWKEKGEAELAMSSLFTSVLGEAANDQELKRELKLSDKEREKEFVEKQQHKELVAEEIEEKLILMKREIRKNLGAEGSVGRYTP